MNVRQKLVTFTSAIAVLAAGCMPFTAFAASTSNSRDCKSYGPITAGLWSGYNMATGDNYHCTGASKHHKTGAYVALGDSVAAGLGLPSAGGDPSCAVSTEAYGAYVADSLHRAYTNLSCSGATIGDLLTEQHLADTTRDIEPQLPRAFADGTPSVISLTAGANDIYWNKYLAKCYTTTCGTKTDNRAVASLMTTAQAKLRAAMQYVKYKSGGHPPVVVVTGYYTPLAASCANVQTNFTAAEIAWITAQSHALNAMLQRTVSSYSFARFAPVDFTGHELCTSSPWIQGIENQSTAFHPTVDGQRAIAAAVVAQVREY